MTRLGVVDVETTRLRPGVRPRTRFWGLALEGGEYHRYETTRDLMEALAKYPDLRVYNHHDYDPCQAIVDRYIPDDLFMRGGRILRCKLGGAVWSNSHALFPDKLSKILEACGSQKLPLACSDHSCKQPGHRLDPRPKKCPECKSFGGSHDFYDSCGPCRESLSERNRSDCIDALSAFLRLGREYFAECGVDPVRDGLTTAASAAFKAAEMAAGPLPVDLRHREAYRGGRTEAFYVHPRPVEADSYDINSSYPAAFVDLPEFDWLLHCRVQVTKDDAPRPFFRENDREEGLIFPAGRFETWFTASNYERYYSQHSGIKRVEVLSKVPVDLRWLKRLAPMISRLFRKRQECEDRPALKYALKIFLNSIYGRLGMRPVRIETKRMSRVPDRGEVTSFFELGRHDYLTFSERYTVPKANYPMAAAITDNARARLYDGMRRIPTLYGDTDSIYAPKGSKFPLPLGTGLGQWKYEKTGSLRIRTVKDYEFAGESHRKGGGRNTQWTIRLALAKRPPLRIDKRRKKRYSKRRVRGNGTTSPLVF